jgi:thioredoxin-dependent peroxiredoxin
MGTGMEGKRLPAFTMLDEDGAKLTPKDLRTPCVLYFYPKDDTPGCTKEACGIRDAWADFERAGLQVYGVSADDAESHRKFREKYGLPFPLLTADTGTLERLGVWKEKSMYGKRFMGISRETLLVGEDGTVLKHYPKVKPEEHAGEILRDFAQLAA